MQYTVSQTKVLANHSRQKKKLSKVKIAVAIHDELGRVPKPEEIWLCIKPYLDFIARGSNKRKKGSSPFFNFRDLLIRQSFFYDRS